VRQQRLFRAEAIVLRERDFGEADRILTLLTPAGKITAMAKGIRRATSRKAGHLGLFFRAQLLLARGRTFYIVSQAESLDEYAGLRGDLARFTYACYIAELMDRFVQEEEESPELFELMSQALGWIAHEHDMRLWTRYYELRLLALAGYHPQLFQCAHCETALQPVRNYFGPQEGGVLCANCGPQAMRAWPISLNAQKVLRFLATRPVQEVARLGMHESTQAEIETLLQHYIEHILERDVQSLTVLKRLRNDLRRCSTSSSRSAS